MMIEEKKHPIFEEDEVDDFYKNLDDLLPLQIMEAKKHKKYNINKHMIAEFF